VSPNPDTTGQIKEIVNKTRSGGTLAVTRHFDYNARRQRLEEGVDRVRRPEFGLLV